ncbi:hypothetical protein B9Z51_01215 [Limnohabitans sp. T6-5]|nr:hypothetical protein B9Z51_01215 [Limnohabitans sp. T6-5]
MHLGPQSFALLFTVVLLAITAYFLLGSVPLLVLKHDNPMDSRFIRSFYTTYFRIAIVAAVATAISYALAGRIGLALGAAAIALLTWLLRRHLITRMDLLGDQIQANDLVAIPEFLKMHKSAILINTTQLFAILLSLGSF